MTGPEALARRSQLKRLSVLIATAGVDMIGFAMVLPLMPFYALRLKATPETIGLMIASFSVAQLIAAPLWGRVSDRYGRRPVLLVGLLAAAAAYLVFGFADTIWLLFLSRIIQGAGGGTTGVAHAYVADTVAPADRAQALGWLSAATSLGVSIGPAISSFTRRWGVEVPGIVAASLCVVNAFFAWRWLPESKRPPAPGQQPKRRPIWHAVASVVSRPRNPVPRLIWIYGAGMLGFTAMTSVLALFLHERFGVTDRTIGYFFAYVGALSFTMRSLFLGPIVRRIREAGAMRVGTLMLTLGLVVYPFVPNVWVLVLVIPLVPVGTALLFPATTALMSRATEESELGTTMGVAQTFAGVARVVAPVISTSAFQRFGSSMSFYLAASIVAGVGVLAFRLPASLQTAARPEGA